MMRSGSGMFFTLARARSSILLQRSESTLPADRPTDSTTKPRWTSCQTFYVLRSALQGAVEQRGGNRTDLRCVCRGRTLSCVLLSAPPDAESRTQDWSCWLYQIKAVRCKWKQAVIYWEMLTWSDRLLDYFFFSLINLNSLSWIWLRSSNKLDEKSTP